MTDVPQSPHPELNAETYINRELSTIAFQRRVLALAQDESQPLLERVKYLAIVGNNLDEFFMVRVPNYIQKMRLGIGKPRPDGYTAGQLLRLIRYEVLELFEQQMKTKARIFELLDAEGIRVVPISGLEREVRSALRHYFKDEVFPVLTPLAVDRARPFPFISNMSLNLGVFLEHDDEQEYEFARIKVPVADVLPRLVRLDAVMRQYTGHAEDEDTFVWIEELIQDNLDMLFPGMRVVEAYPFRVLRNADIEYDVDPDEDTGDVMSIIEQSVRERRFGFVVRVSVPTNISELMLARIMNGLEVTSRDVYMIEGSLGSASLFELAGVDRPDLKYPPHVPHIPEGLSLEGDLWANIRHRDILFHLPYDSFAPVEEFFRRAAHDPDVLAIKATLYRVGKNSPVVNALMEARDNEKQVTVLVELKARFDEENNLEWARAMESKGVHVIYGVEELQMKTHAKISLVVRREPDGVRRYVHLGTGNYNASTARLYTDLSLFTANEEIADDASRLFNRLTGYAPNTSYKRLLVAPDYLLDRLVWLVENEIAAAREGKDAYIILKMNQLEEDRMIQKLYEASQAGVRIDISVRGFCSLRPGIPGISDNIRVISILGRFLEHSRIYYFQNAPDEQKILIGSADIMRRNLYNRVEVVFPLLDPRNQQRALRVLTTDFRNTQAWELKRDGSYVKVPIAEGQVRIHSQDIFIKNSFGYETMP